MILFLLLLTSNAFSANQKIVNEGIFKITYQIPTKSNAGHIASIGHTVTAYFYDEKSYKELNKELFEKYDIANDARHSAQLKENFHDKLQAELVQGTFYDTIHIAHFQAIDANIININSPINYSQLKSKKNSYLNTATALTFVCLTQIGNLDKLLSNNELDVNQKDLSGRTALEISVYNGCDVYVEKLLKHPLINVNYRDLIKRAKEGNLARYKCYNFGYGEHPVPEDHRCSEIIRLLKKHASCNCCCIFS